MTAAQRAAIEVNRAAAPTQKRLVELRQQLGQLRDEVAALKIGKLPFPTRLLDTLNSSLPSSGSRLPAQHLRALCEVNDERWRPAIEVVFARKFAIVVAPEHYEQAEKIYHGLKASELGNETGRESLINPNKAAKLKKICPARFAGRKADDQPPCRRIHCKPIVRRFDVRRITRSIDALPPDKRHSPGRLYDARRVC